MKTEIIHGEFRAGSLSLPDPRSPFSEGPVGMAETGSEREAGPRDGLVTPRAACGEQRVNSGPHQNMPCGCV